MADTALVEKRNSVLAKQAEVAGIFEMHPDLRFSEDERKKLGTLNEELEAESKELEDLVELDGIQRKNASRMQQGGGNHPALPNGGAAGAEDAPVYKSLGQQFIESDGFKEFNRSAQKGPSVTLKMPERGFEYKTTLTETGYAPQAIRIPLILPGALQRPRIVDLVPPGETSMTSVDFMEETTTTNNAAAATEANALGESALAFTLRTNPVQWIGTFLPVTNQLMEDAPAMRSYLDQRLTLFVGIAEDTELYSGSGTPPHLRGFTNATNLQTQAKGSDSSISAILKAMTKIQISTYLPASGLVMHPTDWQNVRLLQETTGGYVMASPADPNYVERLWGLPVVQSTVASQGTAMVGAFDSCCQLFRRQEIEMAVSDSHSTYFTQRMLAIRVDQRETLAIYRGAGFCTVTGL